MDKDAVKQKAYELWEADGKPHGRDLEHWTKAQALVSGKGKDGKASKSTTVSKREKTEVSVDAKPAKSSAKGMNGKSMKSAIADKARATKTAPAAKAK